MLRKVFFVLVLATLAASVAVAAPVRRVKAHRSSRVVNHKPRNGNEIGRHPRTHSNSPSHPRTEHPRAEHPRSEHPATRHREEHSVPRHPRHVAYRRGRRSEFHAGSGAPTVVRLERASLRRRFVMVSALKGSLESLERQNQIAEAEGLERILDDSDLNSRIEEKLLVPVPESVALAVNQDLPENRRYCSPWAAAFLRDLAWAHEARFHRPIQVNSAVRTVEYQKRLIRINGNAAAAQGDIASPHLTGEAIDIGKHGMTRDELNWMRSWLLQRQLAGKIDVEEEFRQACFHISVYKTYAAPASTPAIRDAGGQSLPTAQSDAGGQ